MSWLQIKRNNFKVSSSHFVQQQWTISQLDCDVRQKVDFMTVSSDQLSGWTKKLQSTSKSQTCTQKRSWSLFGDLLLNFGDLEFSESWQNHYIWEVCSANLWEYQNLTIPAASIGQQKGPNSSPWQRPATWCTTSVSEVERIGLWSFASSAILTWPLTTDYRFFKHLYSFLQGMCFHNQQDTENGFQKFVESWGLKFCTIEINSLAKMYWL